MLRHLAAALACLILSLPVSAATLLLDVSPSTTVGGQNNGSYTSSTTFTVAPGDSFTITGLGALDPLGDGLGSDRLVSLWDRGTGTRLTSTTVLTTDPAVPSGNSSMQFFLRAIAPIVIGPGTYSLSVLVPGSGDFVATNGRVGNGVSILAGYHRNSFPNGGDGFPDREFASEFFYGTLVTGPLSAVPLPAPALLLLGGVGALALMRRRRA